MIKEWMGMTVNFFRSHLLSLKKKLQHEDKTSPHHRVKTPRIGHHHVVKHLGCVSGKHVQVSLAPLIYQYLNDDIHSFGLEVTKIVPAGTATNFSTVLGKNGRKRVIRNTVGQVLTT